MLPCDRETEKTEMSVIQRGYLLSMPPSLQSLEKINITPIRAVGRAAEPADPGACSPLSPPTGKSGGSPSQRVWEKSSAGPVGGRDS